MQNRISIVLENEIKTMRQNQKHPECGWFPICTKWEDAGPHRPLHDIGGLKATSTPNQEAIETVDQETVYNLFCHRRNNVFHKFYGENSDQPGL